MNSRRLTGACFAAAALVLIVVSLFLPLLTARSLVPELVETYTVTVWGFNSRLVGTATGPVNAVPVMLAALLLAIATLLALRAVGRVAAVARRRAAWISLTIAAAFTAGVTMTIVPQVVSWLQVFEPMSYPGAPRPLIGWAVWSLAAGTVFAAVAAVLVVVPAQEPKAAETPAPDTEPAGTA